MGNARATLAALLAAAAGAGLVITDGDPMSVLTGQPDDVVNDVPWADGDAPDHPSGQAASALSQLKTRPGAEGDGGGQGYERSLFGQPWTDAATGVSGARNGCDTRSDVHRRDLEDLVIDPGTHGCSPASGTLTDPYTGERITYTRSGESATEIDHVVSLEDAYQSGMSTRSAAERERFANDPLNLLAVGDSVNSSKGSRTIDEWPGDTGVGQQVTRAGQCRLVVRQIAVKSKYQLTVTQPERAEMKATLSGCRHLDLPTVEETDVPAPAR